jgi:hypothetical protein
MPLGLSRILGMVDIVTFVVDRTAKERHAKQQMWFHVAL